MLIKDFESVRISGRCFHDESILRLFPGDGHRLSFVFGGNGSGKSSLSSAFSLKKKELMPEGITSFSLLDSEGSTLDDETDVLEKTYVFNEDFIEKNVRLIGSGLKSIVMLGEAGELADKIAEATDQKAAIDAQLQNDKDLLSQYVDAENPLSPMYWDREISDALTGSGKWNDREKRIRQLQRAAPVNENAVESIKQLAAPELSKEEITCELEVGIKQVVKLTGGIRLPDVPRIPQALNAFSEAHVLSLLAKKIDEPSLNDREKRLLKIAQNIGTSRLAESRDYFSDTVSYCPFCFRDIEEKDVEELVRSIGLVLNEEAKEHTRELSELIFPELSLELDVFSDADAEVVDSCRHLVNTINSLLGQYKKLINDKAGNLYTPLAIEPLGVDDALAALESELDVLEQRRLQWNKSIEEKDSLISHLQELNRNLARLDIDRPMRKRLESDGAKTELIAANNARREESESLALKIADYEAQKSNIKVALDRINSALAFVFLDKDYLVLKGSNGEYRLISRGKDVRPQDVSTGERNAIALCYYFTSIGEGRTAEEIYNDELLLILDDPISSFDQENRIGILSYIREQFKAVMKSNPYSKILCLTHDGYSMGAFYRMREEIKRATIKELPDKMMKNPDCLALEEGKIVNWSLTSMGYGDMLRAMYKYSLSPEDKLRPYMGNLARRALEAFSTFEFNIGVTEFADSSEVLNRLDSDNLKTYFNNLMFHLVLHSESHMKDSVKIEGVVEPVPEYTPDTIDRIVRDVLCLIYTVNKRHVLTHLSEYEDAEQVIDSWVSNINSIMSAGYTLKE